MKKSVFDDGRGQIKLSFGMIFSIILIVVFIAVAFYAIKTFFNIQDSAEVGIFISDLQSDIDNVWRSTESSQSREYGLPSEINYVCFADFDVSASGNFSYLYPELKFYDVGDRNMIFYPAGAANIEGTEIEKINLGEITKMDNPFCLEVLRGKLELTLVKDFGEALVRIEK